MCTDGVQVGGLGVGEGSVTGCEQWDVEGGVKMLRVGWGFGLGLV